MHRKNNVPCLIYVGIVVDEDCPEFFFQIVNILLILLPTVACVLD